MDSNTTVALIVGFLGSSFVAGPIGYLFGRRTRRETAVVSDARDAQHHLQVLRRAYQARHKARRRKPSDEELAELAGRLDEALNLTTDEDVVRLGEAYRVVGEAFAARDPDVNTLREQEAFDTLAKGLRDLHRRTMGG